MVVRIAERACTLKRAHAGVMSWQGVYTFFNERMMRELIIRRNGICVSMRSRFRRRRTCLGLDRTSGPLWEPGRAERAVFTLIVCALMGSPGVGEGKECLKVSIQFLHRGVDFGVEGHLIELLEKGEVEPFAGLVGPYAWRGLSGCPGRGWGSNRSSGPMYRGRVSLRSMRSRYRCR